MVARRGCLLGGETSDLFPCRGERRHSEMRQELRLLYKPDGEMLYTVRCLRRPADEG